jgi:transposase
MSYITGTNRLQLCLFNGTLDEIIETDNIVRFIDAYIDKMDLGKLEIFIPKRSIQDDRGRPAYSPRLLLKIYTYSYLNNIRSSRKIEKECKRNIELIWLTEQLAPDHWSIANFRKNNNKAFKKLFKEFLQFCHDLKLLSLELTAIDGTKMKGKNHNDNVYKREFLEKIRESLDVKIDSYLKELESNDSCEHDTYEFLTEDIKEKLKRFESHKAKLEFINKIFETDADLEKYFANDPDCRFQYDCGRTISGYNGQIAVDAKNKLIVANDVTQLNNDTHQLNSMQEKIKETKAALGIDKKTFCVADAGYYTESEIVKSEKGDDFNSYIPHPRDVKKKKQRKPNETKVPRNGFLKTDFIYDRELDIFICPEGQELTKRGTTGALEGEVRKFKYTCVSCVDCKSRHLCSTSKENRSVAATENHKEMMAFHAKVTSELGKKIIKKRKEIVEHPFGTIKHNWGYREFM